MNNSVIVSSKYTNKWNYFSPQMNCFKNSVATNLPLVFIDSFSSLISLSISCKSTFFLPYNNYKPDMFRNIKMI